MITMTPSGIAGCGMRTVSAKIPKAMVRTTAKIAGGMFRSWAFAIDL
jgi:cytidylate kinase